LPGVVHVTYSSYPLNSRQGSTRRVNVEGVETSAAPQFVRTLTVRANFFETLGIPILAGRALDAKDTRNMPAVAVVNEAFVRTILGSTNPIGARIGYIAPNN